MPGINRTRVHKLLYYCQAHHLAVFDEPLFDERISAWDNGPVVGALWHQERDPSWSPPTDSAVIGGDEAALNTIGYVLSRYGGLSARELVRLTHSEQPWLDADARRGGVDARRRRPGAIAASPGRPHRTGRTAQVSGSLPGFWQEEGFAVRMFAPNYWRAIVPGSRLATPDGFTAVVACWFVIETQRVLRLDQLATLTMPV